MSFCADRGEAVAAEVLDPLREARRERREQQVRPVLGDQLRDVGEAEDAVDHVDVLGRHAELVAIRNARRSSGMAASIVSRITSPRRRRLSAVSNRRTRSSASSSISTSLSRRTRKKPPPLHSKPGNRQVGEASDQLLERQEARAGRRAGGRSARACPAAAPGRCSVLAACRARARSDHAEAAVGDERERVRRVDGERRQDREHLVDEALAQPARGRAGVSSPTSSTATPCSRSSAGQLVPAALLDAPSARRRAALIAASCSAGVSPSGLTGGDRQLAPARSGRRRGPCRTRRGCWPRSTGSAAARAAGRRVARLLQHPLVEGEPGQLAIDEVLAASAPAWPASVEVRVGRRDRRTARSWSMVSDSRPRAAA